MAQPTAMSNFKWMKAVNKAVLNNRKMDLLF